MRAGNQYRGPDLPHKIITAAELVLINVVAFIGQLGWAVTHLPTWHLIGQILFAVSIEGAAICVAYHAYLAEMANDSALKLKIASVMFGFLAGFMNYSHWSNDGKPTAIAIATAFMSVASPWLWLMFSKRVSRNLLASRGLIDPHALRLGTTRWFWHPIRSIRVMSFASWEGQTKPLEAITAYDEAHEIAQTKQQMRELEGEVTRALEGGSTS